MTTTDFHQIGRDRKSDEMMLSEPKKRLGVASSGDIDRMFVISSGRGDMLYDIWGNSYIDCTSQGWVSTIGHSHPRIVEVVKNSMDSGLMHVRPSYYTLPKFELAERITNLLSGNLNKVNFCLHGSLAVEGAIKLELIKRPKLGIAVLDTGFCGRSITTGSLSWDYEKKSEFNVLSLRVHRIPSPYCYRCPFGKSKDCCSFECVEVAEKTFRYRDISMFIYEPIQGNGGQITFPYEYHKLMRDVCARNNVTMIVDEMQTAFGKLPTMFASELYGIEPDIMVIGKALGGGFPLAATVYGDGHDFRGGDQTFTFASFPLSIVASLEAIKIIEDENICKQSEEKGKVFYDALLDMQESSNIIGDIRQEGLLIGVELVKDRETKEPYPEKVQEIIDYGINRGGVLFGCDKHAGEGCVLKIKPPSVISYDNIEKVLNVLREVMKCHMD